MTLNRRVAPEVILKQRNVVKAQQQFMAQLQCYGATDMAKTMQKQIQVSNALLDHRQRFVPLTKPTITLNGKPIPQVRIG